MSHQLAWGPTQLTWTPLLFNTNPFHYEVACALKMEIQLYQLMTSLIYANSSSCCLSLHAATEHAFKSILTSLPKPGGGEYGKFYSLPALNDPRIGNCSACFLNYLCFLPSLSKSQFTLLFGWSVVSAESFFLHHPRLNENNNTC
jgi:hypothetical protein